MSIEREFVAYYHANPQIWQSIQHYAEQLYQARSRGGMRTIIERIRWDSQIQQNPNHNLKISDRYTSMWARLLIWKKPKFNGFFSLKRVPVDGNAILDDLNSWNSQYWNQF